MNFTWKVIYIILIFGFPLLIIIPISIFISPLALFIKRDRKFKVVWLKLIENVFLFFAIIILLMNSILFSSKFIFKNEPFPLQKYSEIEGCKDNLDNIKTGDFGTDFVEITRSKDFQIEKYENGPSNTFSVSWLSENEYRLISQEKNFMMNDTLDVRITKNTPEYYECYLRYGKYAQFARVDKRH